jgi:rRNA maturation endonuclease Nob1
MTRNLAQRSLRPTYEQVRDASPHQEARQLWHEADVRVAHARQAMQAVRDDARLSEEGKREKAQRIADTNAPKILKGYEEARKKVETSAESAWRFSIPMPDGKALANTRVSAASEMVAVQNEANALAMRVEGKSLHELTRERTKNPRGKGIREAGSHRLGVLQAEFASAMAEGGVEGRIKALAVKRLCDETGMPLDDVVDHHRTRRHRDAYADAERLKAALLSIPSGRGMVANPYADPRSSQKRVGTYTTRGNKALMSSGRERLFQKKRRSAWK